MSELKSEGVIEEEKLEEEKSLESSLDAKIEDKRLKCLIANDEPMQLFALNMMFTHFDFSVTQAVNGH